MGDKPVRRDKPTLGRVLLIEDDPLVALALEDALLAGGAKSVAICPSMESKMSELERRPADALVIDVHLSDRDDGWALAELVEMLGTRKPRIVFSTASPEDIPEEVAEMGTVLEKPYDPAELVAALTGEERGGLLAKLRGTIG
jgi:DNA-binding response OmpR family regulator